MCRIRIVLFNLVTVYNISTISKWYWTRHNIAIYTCIPYHAPKLNVFVLSLIFQSIFNLTNGALWFCVHILGHCLFYGVLIFVFVSALSYFSFISLSINQLISQSVNQPINQQINQRIDHSINQSINQSIFISRKHIAKKDVYT